MNNWKDFPVWAGKMFGIVVQFMVLVMLVAFPLAAHAERLRFVALGDAPYGTKDNPNERDELYLRLIDKINSLQPALAFHVGDTKAGRHSCTDALLEKQLGFMNRFEMPLVYTPGDNEWSDCGTPQTGKETFEPIGRLELIRQLYFSHPDSLGQSRLPVERQPVIMPQHPTNVENVRFVRGDLLFVTLHTVGKDNNLSDGSGNCENGPATEFCARQSANIDWLRAAFTLAVGNQAKAIVVVTHADLLRGSSGGDSIKEGFSHLVDELVSQSTRFDGPVLLIHGDKHTFTVERPFENDDGSPVTNLFRLRVPGKERVEAVEIVADTSREPVFSIGLIAP